MPHIALDHALALAAEGRAVFPCRLTGDNPPRKVPCCPHGIDDATTDSAELERLWNLYYGPLIGVRCGKVSGIAVLDIDAKHASARDWWSENRSRLPATRSHRTRSKGLHLIFQYVADFPTTVGRIVRGIDTRSDGGFVIWWPAAGFPVLREGPVASAPDWLLQILKPREPTPPPRMVIPDSRRVQSLLQHVATAPEGQRNSTLYWVANRFREMVGPDLSEGEAIDLLLQAAYAAGLSHREALATTRSGLRGRAHEHQAETLAC